MVTAADQRAESALAWWESLPEVGRPAREDVEVAARLGVIDVAVMARLLWQDQPSLGRHFPELVAILKSDDVPPPASVQDASTDLLGGWLKSMRRRRIEVPLDDAMLAKLRQVSTEDELRRLPATPRLRRPWRTFIQEHGAELVEVLGLQASAATTPDPKPARSHARTGPASPEGFTGGAEPTDHEGRGHSIDFVSSDAREVRLNWRAPTDDGLVRIFRVVASSEMVPWSLDLGTGNRLIAVTYDREAIDDAPAIDSMRHYGVFMNEGETDDLARSAAPVLLATGSTLAPVRDVHFSTSGRKVSARWSAPAACARVEVLRAKPGQISAGGYDPNKLISGEVRGENLTGFVDEAVPWGTWEYHIYSCGDDLGQVHRSSAVVSVQTIQAEPPLVSDLRVELVGDDQFDITWMPLAERDFAVRIYKSTSAPKDGLSYRVVDNLQRHGFTEWLTTQERQFGDRVGVTAAWEPGEHRVYFTAVTVPASADDGIEQYGIGSTVTRNRATGVTHAQLVERVDEQFLSFSWPDGAGVVKVFLGSDEADADLADMSTMVELAEVTPDEYRAVGGVHLKPLPDQGAVVHVVGLSYSGAKPTPGSAATVRYPGLARLSYTLEPVHANVRRGFRRVTEQTGRQLVIRAHTRTTVPVVLVAAREHLPLHHEDGDRIMGIDLQLERGGEHVVAMPELEDPYDYLRLFVELPPNQQEKYAVLDPPLDQLRRAR